MEAIVAVDENWGIGYNDELLCKIPGDMERFKELTKEKVNIVGAKTFKTFPESYQNRINKWVIFSSRFDEIHTGHLWKEKPYPHSIEHNIMNFYEFQDFCESYKELNKTCIPGQLGIREPIYDYPNINDSFIFVGGETVYREFYEYFHKIYVTKIHKSFDKVNKYFPNVDKDRRFEITDIENYMTKDGIKYDFITYERKEMSVDREKFNQKLFYREPWDREYIKQFVGIMEESSACTFPLSPNVPNPTSSIIMMEEFSEAQKELSKFLRGKGDQEGLLEEMADVQICLLKYQRLFGISDELLNKAMCIKLDEFDENHPDCHLKEYIERQIKIDEEKE